MNSMVFKTIEVLINTSKKKKIVGFLNRSKKQKNNLNKIKILHLL